MFTGIIEKTARVAKLSKTKRGMTIEIVKPKNWHVKVGESITVDGICSTVLCDGSMLTFEYMLETLARTTAETFEVGQTVNLEQSLRVGDRLSGHLVQGHIDTTGKITAITSEGNSRVFTIAFRGAPYHRLLAEKGSITVDGISLTVTGVTRATFDVKILPFTLAHTTLGSKKIGDHVNLEFDMIVKHLAELMKK